LLPVEAALDAVDAASVFTDWPLRKRGDALRSDLAQMGGDIPSAIVAAPVSLADTPADREAAIAGILYVIEGSRLGGRFLARQLAADFPARYLDPDQPAGHWRALLFQLDEVLDTPAKLTIAIGSARAVFAKFGEAGKNWLSKE